MILDMVRFICT